MANEKTIPKVVKLNPGYEVVELPWGATIKNIRTGRYEMLFFPDGQEIDIKNWEVLLHDNGVEFISFNKE